MNDILRATVLSLSSLTFAALVPAQTTVQIGASKDNTLYQSPTGTLSNGMGTHIFAGISGGGTIHRAVLAFNVAAVVPAGARIVSATLTLNLSRTTVAGPLNVEVHRLLADWGEGASVAGGQEGGGGTAAANDATWLHRFYPSTFWTTPGGDFDPTPSVVLPTPYQGPSVFGTTLRMTADVQSWLDNPGGNFGWLLKTDETVPFATRRYDSRNNATPGNRPVLTVVYLQPGGSGSFGTGCGSGFTLQVNGSTTGGGTLQFVQSNGPSGGLAATLLGLGMQPTTLYQGCNLYLATSLPIVTYSVLTLDPSGGSTTSFVVPSGLAGLLVVGQAAALDPAIPAGYVLSNAWLGLLQ
jgi:hypothetical protein